MQTVKAVLESVLSGTYISVYGGLRETVFLAE